jgi:hypothetical protein
MIRKKNLIIMIQSKIRATDDGMYIFECPHCTGIVIVNSQEVNCQIFRHGIMKSNGEQVNPHAPKEECEMLSSSGLVHGCCNPFILIILPDGYVSPEKCDWI